MLQFPYRETRSATAGPAIQAPNQNHIDVAPAQHRAVSPAVPVAQRRNPPLSLACYGPAPFCGILPHVSVLHRESVLIVVETRSKERRGTFSPVSVLPKTLRDFAFQMPIGGHFAVSLLHGE